MSEPMTVDELVEKYERLAASHARLLAALEEIMRFYSGAIPREPRLEARHAIKEAKEL